MQSIAHLCDCHLDVATGSAMHSRDELCPDCTRAKQNVNFLLVKVRRPGIRVLSWSMHMRVRILTSSVLGDSLDLAVYLCRTTRGHGTS